MPIRERWESPPLAARLKYAAVVGALQNMVMLLVSLGRAISGYLSPSDSQPALVKTYPCRPRLSVG